MSPPQGVAFLVSQHPAINHALLLREIRALRSLGMRIHTVSIRAADRPTQELSADEQDEEKHTFYVKPRGMGVIAGQLLACLVSHPIALVRGWLYALSLSAGNPAKIVSLTAYWAQAVVIGQWMQRNQLKHIHVQYSSTVGLLLKHMFPIDLSISFHGPDEFTDPAGFWLTQKIEACRFVRAISFFARSQLMRSSQAEHWNKIEVAYMGVDPAAFAPRPFRHDPKPFEFLCVGRLAPVKAQHLLLEAIEKLKEKGYPVLLHLPGGGPDQESLRLAISRKNLQNHVQLHGWVNSDKLQTLYSRADVFVLASFAEGLPGVLLEAMAMEIPCISTWITGVPELIQHGVSGMLVPPADADALVLTAAQLMDDPELRLRVGQQGRQRILERFDLHRNAQHLAGIFSRYIV